MKTTLRKLRLPPARQVKDGHSCWDDLTDFKENDLEFRKDRKSLILNKTMKKEFKRFLNFIKYFNLQKHKLKQMFGLVEN